MPCARSRFVSSLAVVVALGAGAAATSGCDGGGSGNAGATNAGGDGDDDESCSLQTTVSGGVNVSFGDVSQACVYSQRSVGFVPLGGEASVTLVVSDVNREETGTFPARMDVSANKERWTGAECTVNIESNVKDESPTLGEGDGGPMFDRYRLRGSGSCSTPAVYRGDGGTKEPVTIAPFTFVFTSLFY